MAGGVHRPEVPVGNLPGQHPFRANRGNSPSAIADTAAVQREIIADLEDGNVSLVILKRIFGDETLERVKKNFLRNLPQIGALELDQFLRDNYVETAQFGSYSVWQRSLENRSAESP